MDRRSAMRALGTIGLSGCAGMRRALAQDRGRPPEQPAPTADPKPEAPSIPLDRPGSLELLDAVAFSPDGRLLAAGGMQLDRIRLVDTSSLDGSGREPGFEIKGPSPILHLWEAETGRVAREFPAYEADITALCFSSDGTSLFTAQDARYIAASVAIRKNAMDYRKHGSFSGQALIVKSEGGLIRAWSALTGFDRHLRSVHDERIVHLAVGRRHITAVDAAANVEVWDASDGHPLASYRRVDNLPEKRRLAGPAIFSAAISVDATRILMLAETGPSMRHDLRAGTERRWDVPADFGYLGPFSADGRFFVSWSPAGRPLLWDFETMSLVRTFHPEPHVGGPPRHGAGAMAFSPDGTQFAYAWSEADDFKVRDLVMHAETWDVATGRFLGAVKAVGSRVRKVAFTPEGDVLVANGGVHDSGAGRREQVVPLAVWHVPRRR